MQRIDLSKTTPEVSEIFDAALKGEVVVLVKDEKQFSVQLVPVSTEGKKKRRLGTGKGVFVPAEDFDEPADDFVDYVE
jgi:antitoxin (DNA-binding transcriptional repressor) of toxin-antitoxin stability system